ncbi:MAG: 4Fe-4S dicluster domain-containing protein [Candidatus Jordarchaeaceae archaeon]
MDQYFLLIDLDRCYGCLNCQVACKQENNLELGINRIEITTFEYEDSDRLHVFFIPTLCMHCKTMPCSILCPVKAIIKTPENAVIIDKDKCIGCGYCTWVCPYGVIQLNFREGTAEKCTMCLHRLRNCQEPSCSAQCPTKAIIFASKEEMMKLTEGKWAKYFKYHSVAYVKK